MTQVQTSNGVPITKGLRVFTNDCRWGSVTSPSSSGWHGITLDGESRERLYDGSRMTTQPPPELDTIPGGGGHQYRYDREQGLYVCGCGSAVLDPHSSSAYDYPHLA